MEIYLVRHTSVDVPAGYAYGQTDVPLKASFPEEAARVKQALEGHTFDQVWSSPLSRCRRLAAYCGYPEPMTDPRLMEVNFGEWEMKSWDEVSSDPRSVAWFDDWLNEPTPGGESPFPINVSEWLLSWKSYDKAFVRRCCCLRTVGS